LGNSTDYQNGVSDGVHSDFRSYLICTSSVNVYSQGTNSIPAEDGNFNSLYKRLYYTNLLCCPTPENFADQGLHCCAQEGEALWFQAYLHFERCRSMATASCSPNRSTSTTRALWHAQQPHRGDRPVCGRPPAGCRVCCRQTSDGGRPSGTGRSLGTALQGVPCMRGTWQKFHDGGVQQHRESRQRTLQWHAMLQAGDGRRSYKLFYNSKLTNGATLNSTNQSYRLSFPPLRMLPRCNPAGLQERC
jgi:hypothetical protein